MLGVGWLEMLLIGIVALVVIGPKELPALMNKLGKFAGTIRRMGQDFQRELNKTTGLDEIKNLRTSITAPLKATTDAIRKEFNTVTPSGTVQPSGALTPADPKVESVVDEIHAAAGMKLTANPVYKQAQTPAEAMKDAVTKRVAETAVAAPAVAAAAPAATAAKTVKAAKAPAKAAPAAVPAKPKATPKATAKKAVESPAPVEAIAPAKKKPAAKKPVAKKPVAEKVVAKAAPAPAAIVAPAKAPTKRKPAAKKAV